MQRRPQAHSRCRKGATFEFCSAKASLLRASPHTLSIKRADRPDPTAPRNAVCALAASACCWCTSLASACAGTCARWCMVPYMIHGDISGCAVHSARCSCNSCLGVARLNNLQGRWIAGSIAPEHGPQAGVKPPPAPEKAAASGRRARSVILRVALALAVGGVLG